MSKKEIERLETEINKLKKQVLDKKEDARPLMNIEDLKNRSVKELRKIVVSNKLFSGISKLRKAELIEKISNTPWFKEKSLPKPEAKRPTIKNEYVKALQEQRELKKEIQMLKKQLEENEKKTGTENRDAKIGTENRDDDLLKYHDDGIMIDIGHSILNFYVGGSNHPDFPVPQSIVKQALKSQKLPEEKQKELAEELKKIKPVKIQGIPKEVIPEYVPHKSHKELKKRFETNEDVPKEKKKERKKMPWDDAPRRKGKRQEEIEELTEDDNDDEFEGEISEPEEETQQERQKREREEELQKVMKRGERQKKKRDKVKSKLEGILTEKLKGMK